MTSLPEDVVRYVVDVYLSTFNSTLPLFHPRRLLQMIDDWYRQPSGRTASAWACINIVLALTKCHSFGFIDPALQTIGLGQCIENAQSVLTDILKGNDLQLENVQILLGLGIVFLGTQDLAAPMVFVSAAMRFAQAQGMHRRDRYEGMGIAPEEAVQRRRVFWMAYILDRHVALRTRQAPILHHDDMDLDLPPETILLPSDDSSVDQAGFISVSDDEDHGSTHFNIFRAWIELAQIQSRVYDCVFSVRASRMDPDEAAQTARNIRLAIRSWKAKIPGQLNVLPRMRPRADSMQASYLPRVLCTLSSIVVTCLGRLCRVHSMDFDWIDKVLGYAHGIGKGAVGTTATRPSQPQGWVALVTESRIFMRLFASIPLKHPNFTFTQLGPYASSLLCLSINTFMYLDDGFRREDEVLMSDAASFLRELPEQNSCHVVKRVLEVNSILQAYSEPEWQLTFMTARDMV